MEATPEDIRRHFSLLSDETLLATAREDLTDTAKFCYDSELAARRLKRESPADGPAESSVAESAENMVEVAVFEHADEVRMALALLKGAGIPCQISDQRVQSMTAIVGEVKLMVPAEFAGDAMAIIESQISDEELAAQAEAAAALEEEEPEIRE
jgi:hypothetical protein